MPPALPHRPLPGQSAAVALNPSMRHGSPGDATSARAPSSEDRHSKEAPLSTLTRPLRRHPALQRLFHPASIAVIGASPRPGAFGAAVLRTSAIYRAGSPGQCPLPADRRPPLPPEHRRGPRAGRLRADRDGARGGGADRRRMRRRRRRRGHRLRLRLRRDRQGGAQRRAGSPHRHRAQTGMPLVGPNTIGIVNALCGAATFMDITPVPPPAPRAIGLVSQSGALGMALAQAVARGVVVQPCADLGQFLRRRYGRLHRLPRRGPGLRRHRLRFRGHVRAASACWTRRNSRGRPTSRWSSTRWRPGEEGAQRRCRIPARSPARYAAYRAAFRHAGAVLVEDYESLMPTASFFAKAPTPTAPRRRDRRRLGRRRDHGRRPADQHGVPLPQPDPEVRAVLEARIPEFGAARNPCDVTAQVINDPELADRLRRGAARRMTNTARWRFRRSIPRRGDRGSSRFTTNWPARTARPSAARGPASGAAAPASASASGAEYRPVPDDVQLLCRAGRRQLARRAPGGPAAREPAPAGARDAPRRRQRA